MEIILIAGLLGTGLYFVITEYVRLPSIEARKVITSSKMTKDQSFISMLLKPIRSLIEKYYPWNDYKIEKLDLTLKTVGIQKTAKQYCSESMSQSLLIGVFAIPLFFISPIVSVIGIGLAIYNYFRDMKKPEKQLKGKREKIEAELPKFASTISNSLRTTKDVVRILTSYRKVCGDELREELDITLADMKSGNSENALRNFEGRIGSPKLSELVRGLLSVLRGEDQEGYFQIKNAELRKEYIEQQKRKILLRPSKIRTAIALTAVAAFILLIYVLIYQAYGSYSTI